MKWIFAILFVGLLFVAGCPQEEVVPVEPEPEPEPVAPPHVEPEPEPETIIIGYIGPLSGEHASEGNDALNALKLSASELSTKEYVYEIAEQDGQCTRTGASAALNSLVELKKISVVIGGVCPQEVEGMAPVLEDSGVVLIALSNGDANSSYLLNFASSPQAFGDELSKYCKNHGLLRTMIITDGTAPAIMKKDLFDKAAKERGLSTQPAQTYKDEKSFSSTVSVIKGYQPEVVMIFTSDDSSGAQIVNALRSGGISSQIIGDENLITNSQISDMGENAEGIYAMLPEYDSSEPVASYFMNTYLSKYGPSSNELLVSDARNAFYLLDQAEQFYYYKATANEILQYWYNLDKWDGMGSVLSFKEGKRVPFFKIVKIENGAGVPQ